jgi:hypothetical protein
MQIEIVKITVITALGGTDTVLLETKLPQAVWPFEGTATLKLDAARNTGEKYCKEHFPKVRLAVVKG